MDTFFKSEVEYLLTLGSRRTGSPTHNQLVDHIQEELESLGLRVRTDVWTFDYDKTSSLNPGRLQIGGQSVTVASSVPYCGHTDENGVSGPTVSLIGPTHAPDWTQAAGCIAAVNITNAPFDRGSTLLLWPGSPQWDRPGTGIPATAANAMVVNLDHARDAGLKAIVYLWEGISDALAAGVYAPFHSPWFGIPALFVSGDAARVVRTASESKASAKVTLTGELIQDTPTRNVWVIIPGTERPHESIILSTHTDGTNVVEENGHIALLHYAKSLVRSPPKRTTILVFVTAHLHAAPFSNSKRSTTRWLADNSNLWNGAAPARYKAVFATCVEHLGAVSWKEDLQNNRYESTHEPEQELLYASTPELASLLYKNWIGAIPNLTRIINPNVGPQAQLGEGLPFFRAGIPEISLITAPTWLLNEFPETFDESNLIDLDALRRQVNSFERIWRIADGMDIAAFGSAWQMVS